MFDGAGKAKQSQKKIIEEDSDRDRWAMKKKGWGEREGTPGKKKMRGNMLKREKDY